MSDKQKFALRAISIAVILLYLSYLSVFIVNTTFEVFLFEFLILVILFWRNRKAEFITDWVPFISLFVLYEFIRGVVDDFSFTKQSTYYLIYTVEHFVFPTLPTELLQRWFREARFLNTLSVLGYVSFFYYSFLAGFLCWVKSRDLFRRYSSNFLVLTYISLFIFFLLPTAPPWYVNENFNALSIGRPLYDSSLLESLRGLSLYRYFVRGNEVAALPSLHVAWVAYTSFFIMRCWRRSSGLVLLIMPLLVGFSVVINAEHWLLDVLAGGILAYLCVRWDVWDIFKRLILQKFLVKYTFP